MLELLNIEREYTVNENRNFKVLKGINMHLHKGDFIAIFGVSGSGKSTLLNIMGGLDSEYSGDVIFNYKNLRDLDTDVYRRNNVGFIFQNFNLFPHLSVLENVELSLAIGGEKERRNKAISILEKVGLGDKYNVNVELLSGGEKQRVCIARALIKNPDVILADEPTGQLDTDTAIDIIELLKELSKDKIVILVTHDEEIVESYATKTYRLDGGNLSLLKSNHIISSTNQGVFNEEIRNITYIDLFKIAFKNIRFHKLYTGIITTILALSFSLFVLFIATGLGLKSFTNDILKANYDVSKIHINIDSINSSQPPYSSYKDDLESIEGVKEIYYITSIVPSLGFNPELKIEDQIKPHFEIIVNSLPEDNSISDDLLYGRVPNNNFEIVIGKETAKYLLYHYYEKNNLNINSIEIMTNKEIVDRINELKLSFFTEHVDDNEFRYQNGSFFIEKIDEEINVVGLIKDDSSTAGYYDVFNRANERAFYTQLYVNEETFLEIYSHFKEINNDESIYKKLELSVIAIKTYDDYYKRVEVKNKILDKIPVTLYFEQDVDHLYEKLNESYIFWMTIGLSLAVAIAIISIFVVSTLVLKFLKERKKEFGILISLGLSKKELRNLLVIEGIVISICSLFITIVFTILLNMFLSSIISSIVFNTVDTVILNHINFVSIKWYVILPFIPVIILMYIYNVNKIYKLNLVDSLREE